VNESRTLISIDDYDVAAFAELAAGFGTHRYGFVVTPNVDHLIRYYEEQEFRAIYAAADYVLLDSRFLSHVLRLWRGIRIRVCPGSDLTEELFRGVISKRDKVIVIGGEAWQAHQLATRYGLEYLEHFSPPMGFTRYAGALETCLRFIEDNSPFRFCFIGVGCPQQELVAERLKARGRARGLALCVGSSINFLTGTERRAPCWMRHLGMEWLYRALQNPTRLGRRYFLRGPTIFPLLQRFTFWQRPPHEAEYLDGP